jgi:hypothetical protein
MGWTDFDADGQATLALKLVIRQGRGDTDVLAQRA